MALKIHETPAVMSKRERRLEIPGTVIRGMVMDLLRSQNVDVIDACVVRLFSQSNCGHCMGKQFAGLVVEIEGN